MTSLNLTTDGVVELARQFSTIDLTGLGPPDVPWGNQPSVAAFEQAIGNGAPYLPTAYQQAYLGNLNQYLPRLLSVTAAQGGDDPAETILGAVYNHAPGGEVAQPLRRFLVVVADLYDAFLADETRARLGLPLIEQLPPLATFRHDGSLGPYTFPSDIVESLVGAPIGVVSLPSTYREHPLSWGSLSHETAGHDILHADPGLLPELVAGVSAMLSNLTAVWAPSMPQAAFLAPLWSYWVDEAAADVYGLLRMGPSFALNFIPWLAALRVRDKQAEIPRLITNTISADDVLDTHPTDILRIHLALGVTASLPRLNSASRAVYLAVLGQLAEACAGGATEVTIEGNLPLTGGATIPVLMTLPLSVMQIAAASVGTYIAGAPFQALAGRSIQDLETWDDIDESAAVRIATGLRDHTAVASLGAPAHLLAGATLAAVSEPKSYADVTTQLNQALDAACTRHFVWSANPQTQRRSMFG